MRPKQLAPADDDLDHVYLEQRGTALESTKQKKATNVNSLSLSLSLGDNIERGNKVSIKREVERIREQTHRQHATTLGFYDAILELLNEAGDIALSLQLYNTYMEERTGFNQWLFNVSIICLVVEVLMRAVYAIFAFNEPMDTWNQPRCCNIRVPPLRRFNEGNVEDMGSMVVESRRRVQKRGTMLRRLGAFVTMLIEPTTAESMYSRITESTVYEPAEDATSEERFFYTVFNEVMLQHGITRLLFAIFCIEDIPELAIEITVLAQAPDQMTFVWWLSTISTIVHLGRHYYGYREASQNKAGMVANAKEVFDVEQLKRIGFTAQQLKDANFTPKELMDAGYTAPELLGANFSDYITRRRRLL